MKTNIRLLVAAIAISFSGAALAQQFSSSYFMEGSLYRHELNPGFVGTQGYVSLFALGNLHVGVNGNLGAGDVLFNRNGKTVTFLHPDVTPQDALANIKENNKFLENLSMPIISVGFKGFGGFNTFGINVREFTGIHFGNDLFEMLKELDNRSYKVGEFGVNVNSFVEVALGHSRKIGDNLSVGAKLKFLVGAGRVNFEMDDVSLDLESTSKWTATAHAQGEVNVTGLDIKTKTETRSDGTTYESFDKVDIKNPGPGGYGFAVDLGAEYDFKDIVDGLRVSMSLLDLGTINWKESHVIANEGKPFVFNGFENIQVKSGDGKKIGDQLDELKDDLKDLYNLENKGNTGSSSHGIGVTWNLGIEYEIPTYKKLSFGLLSTTRFQGDYTWNEERLSLNYAPARWFEFNVNGALGTFGPSVGWMVNIHPVGLNLFVGMDHMITKVSKQFIPLRSNADLTLGINIPFNMQPKKTN